MPDNKSKSLEQERNERLDTIVASAAEVDPEHRPAFLDEQCAGDPDLRIQAEQLLDAMAKGSLFLSDLQLDAALLGTGHSQTGQWQEGDALGPYSLLRRLGTGGMGDVWLARQSSPIERLVAIKAVTTGTANADALQRFRLEQQALALMDHPNVARVYDSGTTDGDVPYFVMEYVNGPSVTEYCERKALDTTARIELFEKVCAGVRHAHQRGIIHRDLKPRNILVVEQDGQAVPKIIDFGIAKAIAGGLVERTQETRIGSLIGTLDYMAPEQTGLIPESIDTRTDVYSLGVLLYRLLVGKLPVETDKQSGSALPAALDAICRQIPTVPSRRVLETVDGKDGEASSQIASPAAVSRQLRGDLDWITMKALEKDKDRRYESAAALAADLRLHRSNQPVVAGPPTARYQIGKFVRRHRIGTGLTAAVVASLAVFASIMSVQAERLARERDTSERVSGFLADMLGSVDSRELGRAMWTTLQGQLDTVMQRAGASETETKAARQELDDLLLGVNATDTALTLLDEQILARAGAVVKEELVAEPHIAARLEHTLADTYERLGLPKQAERHARRAIALRTQTFGPEADKTLESQSMLLGILATLREYDEGIELANYVLETQRAVLGDEHRSTLLTKAEVANMYLRDRQFDQAMNIADELHESQHRILGPLHEDTLRTQQLRGRTLIQLGQYDEAEAAYREAYEGFRETFGENHTVTLGVYTNIATLYWYQGRYDEAHDVYKEAMEGFTELLGRTHYNTLITMHGLGGILQIQGRLEEALELNLETLEIRRQVLGRDDPSTLASIVNLGSVYTDLERFDEARVLLDESIRLQRRVLGIGHPNLLAAYSNVALLEAQRGDLDKAISVLREALDAGYANAGNELLEDDGFTPLRTHPEFEEVLALANANQ